MRNLRIAAFLAVFSVCFLAGCGVAKANGERVYRCSPQLAKADCLKLQGWVRFTADEAGVPQCIAMAQIEQESGFSPWARSYAGASGIAQIMPATARGWGVNPQDPVASLRAAFKNLRRYANGYRGSVSQRWTLALAAYNAGPGNVRRYGGVPPFAETQHYVRKIMSNCSAR